MGGCVVLARGEPLLSRPVGRDPRAAERGVEVDPRGRLVDADQAAPYPLRDLERNAEVVGEDRGDEAVGNLGVDLDGALDALRLNHRGHRPEHLLAPQLGIGPGAPDQRRRVEVAAPYYRLPPGEHMAATSLRRGDHVEADIDRATQPD